MIKAGRLQVIQNSAPSVARQHQCDIRIIQNGCKNPKLFHKNFGPIVSPIEEAGPGGNNVTMQLKDDLALVPTW